MRLEDVRVNDLEIMDSPQSAISRVAQLYQSAIQRMHCSAAALNSGSGSAAQGFYPWMGIEVNSREPRINVTQSYGFARRGEGVYGATLTYPEMFAHYWYDNLQLMMKAHDGARLGVGVSNTPIPIEFALPSNHQYSPELLSNFHQRGSMTNGVLWATEPDLGQYPLTPFQAKQTDNLLSRLTYYLGLDAADVQETVIVTNYDEFLFAFEAWAESQTGELKMQEALTSGLRDSHLTQFPSMSLVRPQRKGITIIRVGVGSTNAATLMTYLSATRPNLVVMAGHCAGFRPRYQQPLGSFVLARGFARNSCPFAENGIELVPLRVVIPEIEEANRALRQVIEQECGEPVGEHLTGGVVLTTSFRPWDDHDPARQEFGQHRPVAIEMETGAIAAGGFYYRTPTVVCHKVSDHPVEGRVKTRMEARATPSVEQHLCVVLRALEEHIHPVPDSVQSRSIRDPFLDPPFR